MKDTHNWSPICVTTSESVKLKQGGLALEMRLYEEGGDVRHRGIHLCNLWAKIEGKDRGRHCEG